jgi:hypothetical protein
MLIIRSEAMKRRATISQTQISKMLARLRKPHGKKALASIKNHPQGCSFNWERIKEMKDTKLNFVGDGLTVADSGC